MVITRTPLRCSLLGGNTDLPVYYKKYGGLILTTTIDKYIYCILKERFDDRIYVNYSDKEIVDSVGDLKHELVREAMKLLGVKKKIEISFLSDIPSEGSGLGSSSAVTVGVLNALHNYIGDVVSAEQLAKEAVKIEVDILGKPIGIQDQYAVALGGLRWLRISKSGEVRSEKLRVSRAEVEELSNRLMLFYTGVTRSSDSILSSLDIKNNMGVLHENVKLARRAIGFVEKSAFEKVGMALDTYWQGKKRLSPKISGSEIDKMYIKAKSVGALGGKLIGAGGGGFMLLLVLDGHRKNVRRAMGDYKELPFRIENCGSKVIFDINR
jgi:D-glycero-alpha-D-manno-heptose-7-phosphate kinase